MGEYVQLESDSAATKRLAEQMPLLLGLLAIQFACYVPISLAAPFFPGYAEELGIDTSEVGWIFGIYPLASFFAGLGSLSLLRCFGRVKVLAAGGFITSVGTLAFCYSDSYLYFMAARAAQGVGCGLVNAACSALTSSSFEDRDLAFVFALFEAVVGIAYALGPGLGGILFSIGGFQLPFLLSAGISFAITMAAPPLMRRYIKKQRERAAEKLDLESMDEENVLVVDAEEVEEEMGTMEGLYSLYFKLLNWGFGLSGLNMILNSLVWAVMEPLLEDHFKKYMTLSDFDVGQMFLWPAFFYAGWTLGFVYFCRKFRLFRGNMFNIMGLGHVLSGLGLLILAPIPLFAVAKDSELAWTTQVIGLLITNVGIGIGVVPSIPAMKRSVEDGGDFFDDVIGSLECTFVALGTTVGPVAGGYFTNYFGFEITTSYFACFLLVVSIPYFVYHYTSIAETKKNVALGSFYVSLKDTMNVPITTPLLASPAV